MGAVIHAIDVYFPEGRLSNAQLAESHPEWSIGKIEQKTGIVNRFIAAPSECSSDLACAAAKKLFASGACRPEDIDFVLLCTQSPDYFLPTTACLVQERLGIPTSAGALDFNLGCSGFVYGLGLAKGLVESGQARRVLLLTAETYSKFLHDNDKSIRTLFGDAAAATLITEGGDGDSMGPFLYGTDGRGANNLIVRGGGFRPTKGAPNVGFGPQYLYMNGPAIFEFTMSAVPQAVLAWLERARLRLDDIDLFVFHQANQFMLDHLRKKVGIPEERFMMAVRDCGNTVSSTIPIAIAQAVNQQRLVKGQQVLLVGFGVGYSWAVTRIRWTGNAAVDQQLMSRSA
jgi:3-oxoacyl-[acyl-carrier-protein] synthase-3